MRLRRRALLCGLALALGCEARTPEPSPPPAEPVVHAPMRLAGLELFDGQQAVPIDTARLPRGIPLVVRARVDGGVAPGMAARLIVRDARAAAVGEVALRVTIDAHGADLAGTWDIPAELPAGRHMLAIEAERGGEVTALYREMLIE